MATEREVSTATTKTPPPDLKRQEMFLRPAVDIYEDDRNVTLTADLPGVAKDRLDIQVHGNTLTLEGQTHIDMPEGIKALYADINVTGYRRSFTLSNELDLSKIDAQMKDGVLTLTLPKRAELQPRKIKVNTA